MMHHAWMKRNAKIGACETNATCLNTIGCYTCNFEIRPTGNGTSFVVDDKLQNTSYHINLTFATKLVYAGVFVTMLQLEMIHLRTRINGG